MEDTGYAVYTGPINDIDALVAACQFSQDACVLMEQTPLHVVTGAKERQNLLLFIQLKELGKAPYQHIRLNDYTSGRVFDEEAEVRWEWIAQEQQGGAFQAVYVGPRREREQFLPDTWKEQSAKVGKPHTTDYYLFGVRLDPDDISRIGPPAREGDFAQLRIPRLLRYPASPETQNARRLKLEVDEFVDEETGKVSLFRFRKLQPGE